MTNLKSPEYEQPHYWEDRYQKTNEGGTYEWLESYN